MSKPDMQWQHSVAGDDMTVVILKNGNRLLTSSDTYMAGDFVRVVNKDGDVLGFWRWIDWEERPELVMSSIILALATGKSFWDSTKGDTDYSLETLCDETFRLDIDNGMFIASGGGEIQLGGENGYEVMCWDQVEWQEEPRQVMGAIWRAAATLDEGDPDRGKVFPDE